MKKTELLAPAGSLESLKAAIAAGADAVYLGGTRFGARAYADNLSEEDMKWAIDYAHLHHTALYMTINTLLKEEELTEELYSYVKPYYEQGLDAVIVQDFGVLQALSQWFPDLALHASTQMTVTDRGGFEFLSTIPSVTRVVTARELSMKELSDIRENTSLEIETFIHGALCYCYSGQCLYSSLIGGRSGNRGRCAQPCRLPYEVLEQGKRISGPKESYVLSPMDMNALTLLPELLSLGIDSLKIEGRMKRPEYTAGVVSIYRKYIDLYEEYGKENFRIEKEDLDSLEALFRKRGYSQGFFHQHNGRNMMALSAPKMQETEEERSVFMDQLYAQYVEKEKKEKINGILEVSTKNPMKLVLESEGVQVAAFGNPAMTPKNRAMTETDFEKQLRKTGNTPFDFEQLSVKVDGEVFVPNGAINELRRMALKQLEEEILRPFHAKSGGAEQGDFPSEKISPKLHPDVWNPIFHVSVETEEQLAEALEWDEIAGIYIDSSLMSMKELEEMYADPADRARLKHHKIYYILPPVFRNDSRERYTKMRKEMSAAVQEPDSFEISWDGFVIKNLESYQWLLEQGLKKEIVLDANLYTFNSCAENFWSTRKIAYDTAPVELNFHELKKRGCQSSELLIYGHLPMMVTAGCVYKTMNRCQKGKKNRSTPEEYLRLKDRMKKEFPVKPVCEDCYNVIYNSQPLSLLNLRSQVETLAPASLRLMFTYETADEMKNVLELFKTNYGRKIPVPELNDFTRGHFKRGVE